MPSETFTIGIEEEYQIIDPATRELRLMVEPVLAEAQPALGDAVRTEIQRWQIEAVSPICYTLADVRAELMRLRHFIIQSAAVSGMRIGAAALHPFSNWKDQEITPKERYQKLAEEYQQLALEQLISGCHVHIGLSDRDMAIEVLNRARLWLAPLLALSASSPFVRGNDTGYASYRTMMWGRWPFSGLPQSFASFAEYDALVETLVATDSVEDASKIYWDIRIPYRIPTIEFRVMDMCLTIDEAVMIAGLVRALVQTCYEHAIEKQSYADVRFEVLRAAHWRAARYGLDAELIDVHARRSVPAKDVITALLDWVRPALEAAGDWDEIATLVHRTLEHGNGAARQRAIYRQTGRFEAVVDYIVDQTSIGIGV